MKKPGGPHDSARCTAAVPALPAVPCRAGWVVGADADPAARHATTAATAPRPATCDSRRGLCPGHLATCGIRRTIDLTGMTAVRTASTSLGTCFIEQSPHLRLEGCHLP